MHTSQHSLTHVQQCRQLAQQLIQQTQMANRQYEQMLQNEQHNAQVLEQMVQKERLAVQTIQQSLQGHELAIQRCQEVIAQCNQLERELSGQTGSAGFQHQTFVNPGFQTQGYQNFRNPSFRQ
ncbi:hypothetical protein [Neobacillus niacini]|uniref:hypothetical protein n=1 Tax=Neobacillus niacini TaxID=86668 RepID=UPI0020406DA2|nr:hypothetical protein [Neobacillus niacini]MCM3689806.1 hypothetical protein [Neobacillus niacini]